MNKYQIDWLDVNYCFITLVRHGWHNNISLTRFRSEPRINPCLNFTTDKELLHPVTKRGQISRLIYIMILHTKA